MEKNKVGVWVSIAALSAAATIAGALLVAGSKFAIKKVRNT